MIGFCQDVHLNRLRIEAALLQYARHNPGHLASNGQ